MSSLPKPLNFCSIFYLFISLQCRLGISSNLLSSSSVFSPSISNCCLTYIFQVLVQPYLSFLEVIFIFQICLFFEKIVPCYFLRISSLSFKPLIIFTIPVFLRLFLVKTYVVEVEVQQLKFLGFPTPVAVPAGSCWW